MGSRWVAMRSIVGIRRKITAGAILLVTLAFLSACVPDTGQTTDSQPVMPVSDYAKNMVDCLSAEGWEVKALPDNSISSTIPDTQSASFDADMEMCVKKFGYDITPPALSEAEIRELYQEDLATRECIKEQGYDIGEPPSEQLYIDSYNNNENTSLIDPYATINTPGKDPQEYYDLLAICPR